MGKAAIGLLLVSLAIASVQVAEAQQAGKISRVGILGDTPPSGLIALREGLRDLGWVERQNIAIEHRPHDGKREMLAGLASENYVILRRSVH
jgi:putative ABC transport system substrate-binding protein